MRIKKYQSQENITGKGSQAFSLSGEKTSPLAIPKTDQLVWQSVGQVGEALSEIDMRMQEARRVDEVTNAKVRIGDEFSKLNEYMQSDEFLTNTKYQDYGKYRDEKVKEIKEKVYKDVSDRKSIDIINSMWAEADLRNKTKVHGQARIMQVEEGRADTLANLTKLKATFLRDSATANVNGASNAIQTAEEMVAAKVAAGYFKKPEGVRLLDEFRASTTLTMWKQNVDHDPKWAMEQLSKPQAHLSEDNRIILKKAAKAAYESRKSDVLTNKIYGDLIAKHGDDYRKMAEDVMNPNKYKQLDLNERRYLESTFNSIQNNKEADKARAMKEGREADLMGIYESKNLKDKYKILKESKFLTAADKIKLEAQLQKPPVYETDAALKRELTLGIYNGTIKDPSQIDERYGYGLDHADHKELRGMLEKDIKKDPAIKSGMDTFKTLFSKEFAYDKKGNIDQTYFFREAAEENALEHLLAAKPKNAREAQKIVAEWFETQKEGGFNFNPIWWIPGTPTWFNIGGEETSKAEKMAREGISTDPLGRRAK